MKVTALPQTFAQACQRIDELIIENADLSEQLDELSRLVEALSDRLRHQRPIKHPVTESDWKLWQQQQITKGS